MIRSRFAREESGFALPAAIAIVFIVMLMGMALLQTADTQTRQTRYETAGEAAFNLAESAIYAEAKQLQTTWPSTSTTYSSLACNQAATPSTGCPGTNLTTSFASTYAGVDFGSPSWTLQVLDDSPASTYANYYSESLVGTAPLYDANADNKVWIRATATIDGQRRVEVAEMARYAQIVALPQNVITAGETYTANNGNKIIIGAGSGGVGNVALRCGDSSTTPTYGAGNCAGWNDTKSNSQLTPPNSYDAGYTDPFNSYATLTGTQLQTLRTTAIGNGTYYNGVCPPQGTSGIVFVDNVAGTCGYTSNTDWNTSSSPGALIMAEGSVSFAGNENFYGVVYMANAQGTTPAAGQPCSSANENGPVFQIAGNAKIYGGVFVDKCGEVDAGDSAGNVNFAPSAFGGFYGYATPSLVKDSFRLVSG